MPVVLYYGIGRMSFLSFLGSLCPVGYANNINPCLEIKYYPDNWENVNCLSFVVC